MAKGDEGDGKSHTDFMKQGALVEVTDGHPIY